MMTSSPGWGADRGGVMGRQWSFLKNGSEKGPDIGATQWQGQDTASYDGGNTQTGANPETDYEMERKPIEPEGGRFRPSITKWVIFLILIAYAMVSFYRGPILQAVGGFLVVEDQVKKSDLVVCLMGRPVERGLAAADLFNEGLAPKIFFAREKAPDGHEVLEKRDLQYPRSQDLLKMVLEASGVPPSACTAARRIVGSTRDEAELVRDVCKKAGYNAVIVVTSPTHTRRAGSIFRRVLDGTGVEVMVAASKYSEFRAADWWKTERFVEAVVLEYQKLFYEMIRNLW